MDKYSPNRGKPNAGKFKRGLTPWNKKVKAKKGKASLDYIEWRDNVFKRDNNICQDCFMTEKLHAHHIKPWNEFPDLRFELSNGITLCNSCHAKRHGREICNFLKNGTSWAKGKKFSAEYRKKLSDAHKGVPLSEKHKEALRGRVPWNKGLKMKKILKHKE